MFKFISLVLFSLLVSACQREDWAKPGAIVPLTVDQDPSLPSLRVNGTHLHVESYGNPADPLLIIIHGGPGADYRSMLNAKAFASHGFQVVFYNQRGTGLSKREDKSHYEGEKAVQLFIDDLDALISHFRMGKNQKVYLLGHSWGAMLATGYINQNPEKISGAILSEPGGFTWSQTSEYLSKSNKPELLSESLNDATFPEQILAGRSEHEILDYKASFLSNFENGPDNTIGNAGPYPFWRRGSVSSQGLMESAKKYNFDFTTRLSRYSPKVLFLYSEYNKAYGMSWAKTVSAPYPNVEIKEVQDTGHEMLYFGWSDFYPIALTYLQERP